MEERAVRKTIKRTKEKFGGEDVIKLMQRDLVPYLRKYCNFECREWSFFVFFVLVSVWFDTLGVSGRQKGKTKNGKES